MLTLQYDQNIQNQPDFMRYLEIAGTYTDKLKQIVASGQYQAAESSLILPKDQAILKDVQALAASKTSPNLKYHIVVGIGGSSLGAKAVYDAIFGAYDSTEPQRFPKLLFAETVDPQALTSLAALLQTLESSDQFLITVISKSGSTAETLANFEFLAGGIADRLPDYLDRVVVITDEGSALWQAAAEKNIPRLAIPSPVGGRYSVLSAVGLYPLATVGVNVAELCSGASQVRNNCLEGSTNLAATSAALLAYHSQCGKLINDNFFFNPQLESVGKWYRQLMGESIGKAEALDGQTVHAGITPTVSIGSTDLHSVGQLYLGGPRDKFTTFVYAKEAADVQVPQSRVFPELVPMVGGKSASQIMDAILQGVKIAYQKAELPYCEVSLEALDEQNIGAYLQFKMMEMMYLGTMLNVNSFDQPSVELYKIETKKILESI